MRVLPLDQEFPLGIMRSAIPSRVAISIVRLPCAIDRLPRLTVLLSSSSTQPIPRTPRSTAAVNPARPPPTITIC